jgi:hypothetical protein
VATKGWQSVSGRRVGCKDQYILVNLSLLYILRRSNILQRRIWALSQQAYSTSLHPRIQNCNKLGILFRVPPFTLTSLIWIWTKGWLFLFIYSALLFPSRRGVVMVLLCCSVRVAPALHQATQRTRLQTPYKLRHTSIPNASVLGFKSIKIGLSQVSLIIYYFTHARMRRPFLFLFQLARCGQDWLY